MRGQAEAPGSVPRPRLNPTIANPANFSDYIGVIGERPSMAGEAWRILICSAGRYESQANEQVRTAIMDGWAELVGAANVVSASLSAASATVALFRPNIVMGIGSYLPESTYFGEVARDAAAAGAVPVFWATEDPYEQDAHYRIARDCSAVFSCDGWGVNFYDHPCARHLPLAGCRLRHYLPYDPAAERPVDVMFCGVAFSSRKELVSDLLPSLAGLQVQFIGPGWGQFGSAGFSDRRIDKAELIQMYGAAKIVLNLGRSLHFENHRYCITPSTPGPRTFEAALAGAVQFFHEDTYEIRDYFAPEELPCFSTAADFGVLLRRYLSDGAARDATAAAAQRRALAEHTYAHRAQRMVDILKAEALL